MSTLSTKFRVSLFTAALAVATFTPALHGQDVGMFAKVDVPFAFETSSGQHFAPGVYTLRMENEHTLLIKGQSNSGMVMTSVDDNAQPAKTGKATFNRYGNQYFVSEITVAGKSRRLHFQQSKAEKHLQIAASQTVSTTVEVALLGSTR